MITRALHFRRSGSRRPRPSRFPAPGFPRGASTFGRRATPRVFLWPRSTHHVRTISRDVAAALVMVAGIVVWGGFLVFLAG